MPGTITEVGPGSPRRPARCPTAVSVNLYLAILLLVMASGQAVSFTRFAGALGAYGIPSPILTPAAAAFLTAEAAAGLGLLLDVTWAHAPAAVLALAVATAWTILAAVALARRHHVPNCGCFGAYATQRLRPIVLAQDAVFIGLALWVLAA